MAWKRRGTKISMMTAELTIFALAALIYRFRLYRDLVSQTVVAGFMLITVTNH